MTETPKVRLAQIAKEVRGSPPYLRTTSSACFRSVYRRMKDSPHTHAQLTNLPHPRPW